MLESMVQTLVGAKHKCVLQKGKKRFGACSAFLVESEIKQV